VIELLLQAERALSVGLLDRAETLYRQVAAADPRNSIAVVGLARVAIERGNELEALELGRRALDIDPENSAAQRLVQRLEEVRAYRGEPIVAVSTSPTPGNMPAPAPETPQAPAPAPSPEAAPETPPAPEPEPERPPAPAPSPVAAPESPPRARSRLDRLLRRNR
jgi:tetratricopeptide (TPR) repeat protein